MTNKKNKPKVSFGVPYYGRQDAEWWSSLLYKAVSLEQQGAQFASLHIAGGMMVDQNRNDIVEAFLETDGEYLLFVDSDTVIPHGAIKRLLALNHPFTSGIYYTKYKEPKPVAYLRTPENTYKSLSGVLQWERGEIIPVDAVGFGCALVHREVFEAIEEQYIPLQRHDGGTFCVHRDDIDGLVNPVINDDTDGKVINGQMRTRLIPQTMETRFPYFYIEFNRTEDLVFCEMAERVGYKPLLDTSIECGHLRTHAVEGEHYREARLHRRLGDNLHRVTS